MKKPGTCGPGVALFIAAAVVGAVCTAFPAGVIAQGSLATDRAALEALYDATDGPSWTDNTNWMTDAPLDEWHGVTMFQGRVWGIHLEDNALAGPIPSDLGALTNVRWLHLSSNALTGAIPGELGSLENLESLSFWGNELTGRIPAELGRLVNLKGLWLSRNELTGAIPAALGNLANLETLHLFGNELTGAIPASLGNLANLETLHLFGNELTGAIPASLGNLSNLEVLHLGWNELTGSTTWLENLTNLELLNLFGNWGVAGALPASLGPPSLEELNIFFTQTCAPAVWRAWLKTIEFDGRLCGAEGITIDVAVVYTPAARETAGGTAAIEALVDLWVADTNEAYNASGVRHRVALVAREEVNYVESGDSLVDMERLSEPSDGHLDSVHQLRDRAGADLVHLVLAEAEPDIGGRGQLHGVFSICIVTYPDSICFAHELGHNMALRHDRYEQSIERDWGGGVLTSDPAYGYVNQRTLEAGAPESSRWRTIMAYNTQCDDADFRCNRLLRFSNPRQQYDGDPLGVPQEPATRSVDGPADTVTVLNATGPAVALWRDRPAAANGPPEPVGALPPLRMGLDEGPATVNVSGAFRDPDGDPLSYGASSSAAPVAVVSVSGSRVTVTPVSGGAATVRVTATDPGGLSAAQTFTVTVGSRATRSFADHPLVGGVTPIRAVHFTELRERIDAVRAAAGLARFGWTDPVITAGVTPVRLVHLLELRSALGAAYAVAGRAVPGWTDAAPGSAATPIRAAHLMELRAAVMALE